MSRFSYANHHYRSNKYSSNSQSESSKNSVQEPELTQQEKFNQMLLYADELIRKEEFDEAINKLRLLMEKVNFLKQNKKEYDKKLELVIIYNLAAAFQKQWNLDQCIPLLEKFIALTKMSLQESLKASGSLSLHQNTNKHWFKLKTILIKSLLQYCAVLSQIGQHKKALKIAVEITSELKQLFKRGFDECGKLIAKKQSYQQKKSNSSKCIEPSKSIGGDKIEFSYSVLLNARNTLQELVRMQTFNEIIDSNYSQIQTEMKDVKSKIYYWKSNPENNIKMLRQSFNCNEPVESQESKKANSDRNLLGIKRNQSWIEEFTIAKVMFMTSINYLEFTDYDNLIFQFNHRNIIEKIILLSVAYFSLSIELRFLEEEDNQGGEKKIKTKESKDFLKVETKKKEEELQKSQIFHLKSIQVVCKHIKQNSAFVTHLVVNYHKHYKNNLNIIQEQNSIAEYSQLYDARKHSRNNSNFDDQEMIIPLESVRVSHNDILAPNTYRKDSIYYTDSNQELPQKIEKEKSEGTVFSFKKVNKKKTQENEQKSERSRKLGNSSSFSKFETDLNSQKDKTMKKMSSSKMITFGKINDIRIITDRSQKELSTSKQISMKSIDKKSLSKSKTFLKNSITLKQNKSQSPTKDRSKAKQIRDLKESGDFGKRDFAKKKSPQTSRALDLLKRSGSLNQIQLKLSKDFGTIRNAHGSPLQMKKKG